MFGYFHRLSSFRGLLLRGGVICTLDRSGSLYSSLFCEKEEEEEEEKRIVMGLKLALCDPSFFSFSLSFSFSFSFSSFKKSFFPSMFWSILGTQVGGRWTLRVVNGVWG